MPLRSIAGVVLSVMLASLLEGQTLGRLDSNHDMVKVDNGLLVAWQIKSEALEAKQVEVYSKHGSPLVRISLLRLVPEATRISIDDVAVDSAGQIAVVAAAYTRRSQNLPTESLLYFDFRGNLLSAFALRPSRAIARVAVDGKSHVWALTSSAGGLNPL